MLGRPEFPCFRRPAVAIALAGVSLLAACATAPRPAGAPAVAGGGLPPVPARSGALTIDLVYPAEGATVTSRDSTFVFGSVGTGAAQLSINGAPVQVAPNGAFLGYLPVPRDGVYRLTARAAERTAEATRTVRVPAAREPADTALVAGSVSPSGALVLREGEPLVVRLRGEPGLRVQLVLPDSTIVPLAPETLLERAAGFMLGGDAREVAGYATPAFTPRTPIGAPGATRTSVLLPAAEPARERRDGRAGAAYVEAFRGSERVQRLPLPLTLGLLPAGAVRVVEVASTRPDSTLIGVAVPGGNTPYHWFFPNRTRLAVSGERNGELRVQLTDDLSVWVAAEQVRLLPGNAPPGGAVGAVRAVLRAEWVDVRLATTERLPFRVDAHERGLSVTVYGAATRTSWLQYGPTDTLIQRLAWAQPRDDEYRLEIETAGPLWGYEASYDAGGSLVVRVRRPPTLDARQPLRGLYVAVDAGHPPGGAIGPTRLLESEANLGIARRLAALLRERGARVLETRPDSAALGLAERPLLARDSSVHLLVSVHNNAFPDGVNPFENNGTTVFYNHAPSLALAKHLQHELVRELGVRDLGIARADLALVRPTWMPSALTESLFLMLPQQEAALRDPAVLERMARAHLRGIEAFLRERQAPSR